MFVFTLLLFVIEKICIMYMAHLLNLNILFLEEIK